MDFINYSPSSTWPRCHGDVLALFDSPPSHAGAAGSAGHESVQILSSRR